MILVYVSVSDLYHESASLQIRDGSNHACQKSVAGNIEWKTTGDIRRSIIGEVNSPKKDTNFNDLPLHHHACEIAQVVA